MDRPYWGQVTRMLQSLHIHPQQLPVAGPQGPAAWDAIFAGGQPQLPQAPLGADLAAGSRAAAAGPASGYSHIVLFTWSTFVSKSMCNRRAEIGLLHGRGM